MPSYLQAFPVSGWGKCGVFCLPNHGGVAGFFHVVLELRFPPDLGYLIRLRVYLRVWLHSGCSVVKCTAGAFPKALGYFSGALGYLLSFWALGGKAPRRQGSCADPMSGTQIQTDPENALL